MAFTALLDANVIYAAPLRDLLIRLALADLFRARWSADIHSEWMRTLAATRPDIPADRIERLRRLIDEHVRDAVVDGYAALIPSLTLPDPNDRHVLAAAIVGRADVIVTCNVTDFPAAALAPYGIDVQHPDQFLSYQLEVAGPRVVAVVRELRASLVRPPLSAAEYVDTLRRQQLPAFVERLAPYLASI